MTRNIFDDLEKNRDYTIERLDKISSAISLFTVSSEIKFLHFNMAADALFGYDAGGLSAATAQEPLKILHPDNEDQFYGEIIATMRDGRYFNYNCRILCGDGTYKWAKISAELVRQSGGTLYYYGVITPISAPDNILLRGLHVLIAAGDESDRSHLSELIESKGGTCDTFEYGLDGLDRFETSEPDFYQCIFIGNRMKDVNGLELLKEIRHCGHIQAGTVPAVMLADAFDEDEIASAKEMGAAGAVTKPFDPEKIAERLTAFTPEI